jgi:tRNA U54 and U55 pseudouridine synthase Pus10
VLENQLHQSNADLKNSLGQVNSSLSGSLDDVTSSLHHVTSSLNDVTYSLYHVNSTVSGRLEKLEGMMYENACLTFTYCKVFKPWVIRQFGVMAY